MTQQNKDEETTVVIDEEVHNETAVDEVVELKDSVENTETTTQSEEETPSTDSEAEETKQAEVTTYHRDGSGGMTADSDQSTDNDQHDDGNGTLAVEEKSETTDDGVVAETKEDVPEQEEASKEEVVEAQAETTEAVKEDGPEHPADSEETIEKVESKEEPVEEEKVEEEAVEVEEPEVEETETEEEEPVEEEPEEEVEEDSNVAPEPVQAEQPEEEVVEEAKEETPEPTPAVSEEKVVKEETVSEPVKEAAPETEQPKATLEDTALIEKDGELVEVPVNEIDKEPEPEKEPEIQRNIPDKGKREVYDRDPAMDKVLLMTVRSIKRQLSHVTNIKASSKNNRHYTLIIESDMIDNLFLHGISRGSSDPTAPQEVVVNLQKILNHWNSNLGVLPDSNFNVCVMRLVLDERLRTAEVGKNSLLRDEDIRKKVYSHYMHSRWEWSFRSILPVLEMTDICESRTRYVDGEIKTRIRVGSEWTPFLEDMEEYFGLGKKPFGDVTIPERRQREVGISLKVLGTNNPRIVGHLVKLNAIRKVFMAERAEDIQSGKIEISETERVDIKQLDPEDLAKSIGSNMG